MKPNHQIIEAILAADEKKRAAWNKSKHEINTCYPCTSEAQCIDQLRALLAENELFKSQCEAHNNDANRYLLELSNHRTELRAALYPGGCKHPQQGKWQWLIEQVKQQRAVMEKLVGGVKHVRELAEFSQSETISGLNLLIALAAPLLGQLESSNTE